MFFMIAQAWCRHVRKVLYVEKAITWVDIPGYRPILKALLTEMQRRTIRMYPDALVETIKSFLTNAKLLNVVIKIAFSKTYIFESLTVMRTLEMTSKWFLKLNLKRILIPSDFDWTFFMDGIHKLIDLDHSTATAKVIWLLYQILHVIPKKERD